MSFISLLANIVTANPLAFSVEKPGNKNRQTTHFILKALLPLRRWVWIAVSRWTLLSLCEGSLNIRAAASSGTFWYFPCTFPFPLYNAWTVVTAYNWFYDSSLCWESPEWPGNPRTACESLCSLSQAWVMVAFTSLRALQRVTLEITLYFVDQKVVVVSEHLFQGKNFLYSLCISLDLKDCPMFPNSNLQIYLLKWQVFSNKTNQKFFREL